MENSFSHYLRSNFRAVWSNTVSLLSDIEQLGGLRQEGRVVNFPEI